MCQRHTASFRATRARRALQSLFVRLVVRLFGCSFVRLFVCLFFLAIPFNDKYIYKLLCNEQGYRKQTGDAAASLQVRRLLQKEEMFFS